MGMTREEKITKEYIQTMLSKQGYPTYANIFSNFDLNLTDNPNVVGFMEPSKGRIVVNRNLQAHQVSVIIRHEILHFFLEHEQRLVNKLAKKFGLNPDNLSLEDLENIKREIYKNKKFNIAGDYEISNRGYTDEDKEQVRNIELNGQILSGLVTEDKHPDWVDWSLEDMYDALNQEDKEPEKDSKDQKNSEENSSDQSSNDSQDQDDSSDDSSESGDQDDSSETDGSENNSSSDSSSSSTPQNQGEDSSESNDDSNESSDSEDSSNSDNSSDSSKKRSRKSKNSDKSEEELDNTPQIGDRGNEEDLAKEDAERDQQIQQEKEEYPEDDDSTKTGTSNDSGDTGEGESDSEESRLDKIKKILQDKDLASKIEDETDSQVAKSRSNTAARNAKKYRNTPIKKFEDSLNKFIKNEVGDERNSTWRRFNKNYAGSDILRPGRATVKNKNIPLINVYFDRSGSWDEAKTKVGEQAIGTLNNYVRKKQIKIMLYYFANKVSDQDNYQSLGGLGTYGEPILQHIKQTKPDNVIVMTDDDIRDCTSTVQVPGAVWFLWKGGVSKNLQQHLSGKMETNNYELS